MKLGVKIHNESFKEIVKTSNHRLVFNLNINNILFGVVTIEYDELNGSLDENDEVVLKYFVTGSSGYKVIDTIDVNKNNGSLKRSN